MPKYAYNPEKEIPDLSGKVVLVTGGNAGIGAAFVKAVAAHNPSTLYLCCRKTTAGQAVIDTIHKTHASANIQLLTLDLNSFASVKACAADFNAKADRLDLLFLNAGVSATSPHVTEDGYENQFGINHMGHALFTQLIMPKLLETSKQPGSDVRIMLTSSIGHNYFLNKPGLALSQMKSPAAQISPMYRYGHSKLANILFAQKLAQLYPSITSTSHHPGTVKSEIWGKASGMKTLARIATPFLMLTAVDTDDGAKTGLWCAFTEKGKVENGKYYEPVGKMMERNVYVKDQKYADELWEWTNKELAEHGAPGWPQA